MMKLSIIIFLLFFLPLTSAATNVRYSLDGTVFHLAYDGAPPFSINIRGDKAIGQPGGYLWAVTNAASFSYNLAFAINPTGNFFVGVKDSKGWSGPKQFYLHGNHACLAGEFCRAEDALFPGQACKREFINDLPYCSVPLPEEGYYCKSPCLKLSADRVYENIHTSPWVTWYFEATPQLSKEEREQFVADFVARNFEITDRLYRTLNEAFGGYEDRRYYIELTDKDENRGVFWTPTLFGGGMGMHYDSQRSATIYDLILHEFINSFAGYAGGGYPTDWWVNHRSPFPSAVKPYVLDKMGMHDDADRLRREAANAGWEDYSQYLFFQGLLEEQGLGLFRKMFLALKADKIMLTDWVANPSITLSHYFAAYLSAAAGRNLADEMNARKLGQYVPPNTIPKYTFDKSLIDQIIMARNQVYELQDKVNSQKNHPKIKEAETLLTDAWTQYRMGNHLKAFDAANQGLAVFN